MRAPQVAWFYSALWPEFAPALTRIVDDVSDYRQQLDEMSVGVEAELSVAVDAMAPMAPVIDALEQLRQTFGAVHIILSVHSIEETAFAVSSGAADLGVLPDLAARQQNFERNFCGSVQLVPVSAPHHPLAAIGTIIEPSMLVNHLQLVLTNRVPRRESRDYGVHSVDRWHVTDLETKHQLLLTGLGWGSMPRHRVQADLSAGRLVELSLKRWEGADEMPEFDYVIAHRADKTLGKVGKWFVEKIAEVGRLHR